MTEEKWRELRLETEKDAKYFVEKQRRYEELITMDQQVSELRQAYHKDFPEGSMSPHRARIEEIQVELRVEERDRPVKKEPDPDLPRLAYMMKELNNEPE